MGVGTSTEADSRAAGTAAARAAVTGDDPTLLLVFAASGHDLRAVQEGIRAVAPGAEVVGCTTQGEIAPGGVRDGSITVAALGGAGFAVRTAVVRDVSGRQREAGAEAAAAVAALGEREHVVLMLLTDGLVRDQEGILRGAYGVVGAGVPLFGGAAGDGWQMRGTYLLANGEVHRDAVVAVALASDAPMAIEVQHGWNAVGEPMIVTAAADGRVQTLDDRPALDVFLDRLGAPPEAYTDRDAFTEFALPRPLGVQRRSGVEARNLSTESDLESRSIGGGGTLDHGCLTWAMEGDEASILAATDRACEQVLAALPDRPVGMLTFSCAALRAVLGDDGIQREVGRLEKWADGVPFAGFYTYGEIARVRGIDGFHNQTLVVLAFA
jgi:hypothetical protein